MVSPQRGEKCREVREELANYFVQVSSKIFHELGEGRLSCLCSHRKEGPQLSLCGSSCVTHGAAAMYGAGPRAPRHRAGCGEWDPLSPPAWLPVPLLTGCREPRLSCRGAAGLLHWRVGKLYKSEHSGGGAFRGNLERRKTSPVAAVVRLKASKNFQSLESKMRFSTS